MYTHTLSLTHTHKSKNLSLCVDLVYIYLQEKEERKKERKERRGKRKNKERGLSVGAHAFTTHNDPHRLSGTNAASQLDNRTCAHNIFIGSLWADHYGTIMIDNTTTG